MPSLSVSSPSCAVQSGKIQDGLVSWFGNRRVGGGGSTYHSLVSELLDLLDRLRGPLLEGDTVELPTPSAFWHTCPSCSASTYALVHVDGVLAGHDVGDGRASGLS
jgi:hypothetical protein